MTKPHIITVSGPSLSGKTELSKILQKDYGFNSVISVTTRARRSHEQEGVDYYFLTEQEYQNTALIQKTHFNGFNYGVSEKEVLDKSNAPILWVVAPESINQIEQYCKEHDFLITRVFVTNPEKVLLQRLFLRFKEDENANVESYVSRLSSMIGKEKEWVQAAQSNSNQYDVIITEFNKDNTQEMLNKVLNEIDNKELKLKKRIKP